MTAELVASFFTLSGSAFGQPARHPFPERCSAAAQAGFAGIGFHVDDLERTVASGTGVETMREVLDVAGLRVVEIEFLSGWALDTDREALSRTEAKVHAVADAFGGRHVSAGEFTPSDDDLDVEAAGRRLAQLCGRLAEHDLLVAVEAFPWSPIRDICTARRLLDAADAANAGLLIDVWHFYNCSATLDDLDGLPAGRIAAVQLNDGPRVHDDYLRNARTTRWLPGDGDLDVVPLVSRLAELGFTGPYCIEVNYPEFRELPAAEAARQAADRAHAVLREAGL